MKPRFVVFPLAALIVLAVFAQPGSAQVVGNPGEPTLVVYPTGVHPLDVTNVQSALDGVASPGTVVLKAVDMAGNPLAFNFGGTTVGSGGVIKLLRPDITLTGDGWDDVLGEPKTRIVGGGGFFKPSPSWSAPAVVVGVQAPGITVREITLTSAAAGIGIAVVSTTAWPASDHAVVIEQNHISVVNIAMFARNTAAFPVRVNGNVLRGRSALSGQWIGFTLRPITSPVNWDEPVVPEDPSGNPVRYPFEVTDNDMVKTPGSPQEALLVYGWANYYNVAAGLDPSDPDVGCKAAYTIDGVLHYQCVTGDNGPVLVVGNRIGMSSPGVNAISLGWGDGGLSHVVAAENTVSGTCLSAIRRFPYGTDAVILDNDLSGVRAVYPIVVHGADTVVAGNVLAAPVPLAMPLGLIQPAVWLLSKNLNPGYTPMPHPTENCLLMHNDYRLTGLEHGAVLLVSQAEFATNGVGTEVKNNIVFEVPHLMPGTWGIEGQVTLQDDMINPATGLPYVHDNRIVGVSANGLDDPGIGGRSESERNQGDAQGAGAPDETVRATQHLVRFVISRRVGPGRRARTDPR